MNKVLERATGHFRGKMDGSLQTVEVPEWETTVYYRTTSTLKDESTVLKLQQEGKTVEALVQSIIVKALNEDGTRMFAPPDRVLLMNEVDPQVVIRLASVLNGVDQDTLEDVEKN